MVNCHKRLEMVVDSRLLVEFGFHWKRLDMKKGDMLSSAGKGGVHISGGVAISQVGLGRLPIHRMWP